MKKKSNGLVKWTTILIVMQWFGLNYAEASTIEVGFSPEGSAQRLVLKAIRSAKYEIRILCYSFTSRPIIDALIEARLVGVDIKIVVDAHADDLNLTRHALQRVRQFGIRVRYNNKYKILHDKVMIIDQNTVETGSYNFTKAAARENSENVIVVWKNVNIASRYLDHWRIRWNQSIR